MRHVEPKDLTVPEVMAFILGGVSPRPIALVSTLSKNSVRNLSPFSFFNAFGANPPVVAFSPSRRQRDNTTKDTYHNLIETKECVIQAVTYAIVQQVNLASTEYPPDVDEFVKCGLTPVKSDLVAPDRVAESPFQMECRLQQMVHLGDGGGSGNLAICEVVKFHVAEDLFEDNVIQPNRIDTVGRNSADYYTRASGDAIFSVAKPKGKTAIGYDNLPAFIRESHVYSGNNLGQLAGCTEMPDTDEVRRFLNAAGAVAGATEDDFKQRAEKRMHRDMLPVAVGLAQAGHDQAGRFIELTAQCALENGDTDFAWKAAMSAALFDFEPKNRD